MTKKIQTIPVEHNVMAVIDNFQCDLPEITLFKNLSIRRIDTLSETEQAAFAGEEIEQEQYSRKMEESEYKKQLFHHVRYQSAGGEIFDRTVERANFVLYWHFKGRVQLPLKQNYDFLQTPSHEFEWALSAFRVLKDAMVGLYPQEHNLIESPLPKPYSRSTQRSHDGYQLSNPHEVEPYVLLSQDVEPLKQLFNAIKSVKQPGLITALSRLDNQYTRAYIADRLIDAVIALESLYTGGQANEIVLRVGLRVSAHLGGNDADLRERYFDLFRLGYDIRSRLVHGSIHNTREIENEVKKKGWQNSEIFMAELDDMLRRSLRYILLNVKDRKLNELLHEPLDKAIRRGESFIWE